MTTIYLIRHAEAEGNVFRRFHGQYDGLLTPRGLQQAKCLEKRFENTAIDACFSSDLTRTCLTSRAIYMPKGLHLHRDARFREISMGIWEDVPYGYLNIYEAEKMHQFNHNPPEFTLEGAEKFDDYTQRFLEGMIDAAQSYDGGTIAIFAHGAVIRSTLMRLFFMHDIESVAFSDNTGVCKLTYNKGDFSYEFLNDSTHIPEELTTYYSQRWWRLTGKRRESSVYFIPVSEKERSVMLIDRPVGTLILADACGDEGIIERISLGEEYLGRNYSDQVLGEAVSHFRNLGCKRVRLPEGQDPELLSQRYCGGRNFYCIDTKCFTW